MRNARLNQVRHKNSGPHFVDLDKDEAHVDAGQENPHVLYLRNLEREEVRKAIGSLPDAYREIVVLRDIEGFTYQEIATVLDCPAGTVMSRLGRARGKLRKLLAGRSAKTKIRAAMTIIVAGILPSWPALAQSPPSKPFNQCPKIGASASCAVLYVFNADGTTSVYADTKRRSL